MKLLSLFSGIGAFETALDYLNVKYELVNYCEIDKYASKSYSLIHDVPETKNLWDVTKVDTGKLPKDIDLITYGFPCQDISLAGKQKGFEHNGERTRSGLFFEALRIIEDTQPRIAIAENVKNLNSKKFKNEFEIVLNSLKEAGYNNYWQVLNAKDYGVPQNRERVFIVSIRKDIDTGKFKFPEPYPLKLKLKDMLEDEVDEKYFLSDSMINYLENGKYQSTKVNNKLKQTETGIPTTLNTMQDDNRQPKIFIKEATKKGYAEACEGDSVNLEYPNSTTRRGRVGKQVAQTLICQNNQGVVVKGSSYTRNFGSRGKLQDTDGCCSTLVSAMGTGGGNVPIIVVKQ